MSLGLMTLAAPPRLAWGRIPNAGRAECRGDGCGCWITGVADIGLALLLLPLPSEPKSEAELHSTPDSAFS